MKMIKEINFYVLAKAVERGRKLYPGTYSFQEWIDAWHEEIEEAEAEIKAIQEGKQQEVDRLFSEILDCLVVGYRLLEFLQTIPKSQNFGGLVDQNGMVSTKPLTIPK